MLRDMGLAGIAASDARRLEVLVTGLPLHRGVPLAVDATLVASLHANGQAWANADAIDGVAIARAEQSKRETYPQLVGSSVARLTTMACETGGRWSKDALVFLRDLAAARAREAPAPLRAAAAAAWRRRWLTLLSVAQQDSLAASLVDDGLLMLDGCDGIAPTDVDVWLTAAAA